MIRGNVTEDLIFKLVTSSHATGVINLCVAAVVEYRGQVLLVASGDDELDSSFELPFAAVLPGEHLLDALCRCLAVFGLSVRSVTGYLGHHDRGNADDARHSVSLSRSTTHMPFAMSQGSATNGLTSRIRTAFLRRPIHN